ncbi:hypothetical protein [Kineococcus sp. R86509]|uniref:hypothetical protein n=1 Tax=Kineococcus sp. R86509 TaxID=3093851 RepID=UPI0036D399A7
MSTWPGTYPRRFAVAAALWAVGVLAGFLVMKVLHVPVSVHGWTSTVVGSSISGLIFVFGMAARAKPGQSLWRPARPGQKR